MNKYERRINGHEVDVYDVLKGFNVECQAIGHAIKKLLAAGQRGHKSTLEDKREAISSIERSIQMDEAAQHLASIETEPLPDGVYVVAEASKDGEVTKVPMPGVEVESHADEYHAGFAADGAGKDRHAGELTYAEVEKARERRSVVQMFDEFLADNRETGHSYSRAEDFELEGVKYCAFVRSIPARRGNGGIAYWRGVDDE